MMDGDAARERFFHRLENGISVCRVLLMLFIVSGHVLLVGTFFQHFSGGRPLPLSGGDIGQFQAALAAMPTLADRVFFCLAASFWSLNFAFFAVSGLSLWLSTLKRGVFDLRDYFFGRFFGVYMGYALAALTAFFLVILVLGHKPGEHDLNYLLLGVARARETMAYNDTLWFIGALFVLYLVFPAVPALYRLTGLPGLLLAAAGLAYAVEWRRWLVDYSFLPTALLFFLLGAICADVAVRLSRLADRKAFFPLLAIGSALVLLVCARLLTGLTHGDLVAAGAYAHDTHAIGLTVFLAFLALGLLIPEGTRTRRFFRAAGRGTFAVYVYHYLFIRLFNNHPGFAEWLKNLPPTDWPLVSTHLLAGCLGLFAVLLLCGWAYQYALDAWITGPLKRYFSRPLRLDGKRS